MNRHQRAFMAFFISAFVRYAQAEQQITVTKDQITLPTIETAYTCASRRTLDKPYSTFWARDEKDRSDFIYFDRDKWAFLVCLDGKMVTGALEAPMGDPKKEYTKISVVEKDLPDAQEGGKNPPPYLEDINGDGKREFIGQIGQCVEGPCMGDSIVFQVDGKRIKRLYTINSWGVSPVREKGRPTLEISQYCFNHSFGVSFIYFTMAEFKPDALQLVPYSAIREKYPKVLNEKYANASSGLEKLLFDAYRGKRLTELETAYNALLKKNPTIADVHCNPLEILRMISGAP